MTGNRTARIWVGALVVAGVVVLAAVAATRGSTSDAAMRISLAALATPQPSEPPSSGEPNVTCSNPTASLRPTAPLPPPGHMPTGSFMRTIQKRGRLIAGVDQNTLLFGYLNPSTGRLEGFEIDLLRKVAQAIFGNPNAIEFKAITTAQRLPYVEQNKVDIVADAFTIDCYRRRLVDFSTVYYDAGQRLLVPAGSHARGMQDMGGKRVCATASSTSLDNIAAAASHPIPYPVAQRTDCLVALQEGRVAGISTDDAILLGFAAQDPYTKIVGPRFSDQPYGMAVNKAHPDFVRFVNALLARWRADGTWARIYRKWLGGVSAHVPPPPEATYR
jgi:polar amino acid transport system substrate-binding protein